MSATLTLLSLIGLSLAAPITGHEDEDIVEDSAPVSAPARYPEIPGMVNIAKLANLDGLFLDKTRITDAGLVHLNQLSSLKRLSLENTQITDDGVMQLAEMPNLKWLWLEKTRVTDAGVANLERKLPTLSIHK